MIHPREALLQEARAFQKNEAFTVYRKLRQATEHRLARLMQLGVRQARYFGRTKTLFQLLVAATVANLTLVATRVGLMRDRNHSSDDHLPIPLYSLFVVRRVFATLSPRSEPGFSATLLEHILLVTDGLSSYKSQALKVFRQPLYSGKACRPRLVLAKGVMIARVMKRCQRKRVVEVSRSVVVGCEAEVISRVIATQRSMRALINTAYIERLQASFRSRLAPLVRKTRAGAHRRCTLEAGMWLVGTCYNLVRVHRSLTESRTPAMAASLTDHRWSMEELLSFPVPPAQLPRWRGRKPKWLLEIENAA